MILNIGVPRTGTVYAQRALSPIRPHGHYVPDMTGWPDSTFKPVLPEYAGDFTFAVVRNPYDLIVSWWSLMFRHDVQQHHPDRKLAHLTFRDAVTLMAHRVDDWPRRPTLFHQLLTPDWKLTGLDYLARYETLDADLREVARLAGGTYTPQPPANSSERNDYRGYYDDHLIGLVEDAWGADLSFFGYSIDGPTGNACTTFGHNPRPTSLKETTQ